MDDTAQNKPVIPPTPVTPAAPPPPPEFSPEPPPDLSQPPPQAGSGQTLEQTPPPPPPPPPPPQSGEVTLTGDEVTSPPSAQRPLKKILIAVGIILVAALIVGVFFFLQGRGGQQPLPEEAAVTPTPAPLTVSVENPKNGQVFSAEEITVSGKTLSGSVVAFVTDVDGNSVESDDQGSFTAKALLGSGVNEVLVAAADASGQTKEDFVYVVFDEEEKNQTGLAGVVTNIRDGVFSLKQKQGTSLSVGTNSNTVVVGGGTLAAIKVGDILVAIATASAQATVSAGPTATKLYVREASPSAASARPQILTGVIAGVNDAIVTIKENNEEVFHDVTVASTSAIKASGGAGIAALQLGQQVLAIVTTGLTDDLVAKLIHVISR